MSLPPWEQRARQQTRSLFTDPAPPPEQPAIAPPVRDGAAPPAPAGLSPDLHAAAGPPAGQRFPTRMTISGARARVAARWAATSLRARLLAILVVALLAALAVTGYGVQAAAQGFLIQQVDQQLDAAYQRALAGDERFLRLLASPNRAPGALEVAATRIYLDHSSTQFTASLPNGSEGPEFRPITSDAARAMAGQKFTLPAADGGHGWRAVAIPVTVGNNPGTVMLALPTQDQDRAVDRLRLLTLLIGGLVILLCATAGWLAIRRAFQPLLVVEDTAAAIAAGDLSQRIPERPATTEVGRLTASLNGMLSQIESAFRARQASEARTKRFAADASHELRTPLASIRGFAELYRQGAVPSEEVPRTMRRIEDEAKRMGGLVEDLLMLARLDEQRPGRSDPVDLAVLAGDAVHDAHGLAPDRTVRLVGLDGTPGPVPATAIGDEDRLRQVMGNLLANAVRHTPAGTPVEVAVGVDPAARHAVIEVRDHGPGLPPEQAQRVFERFYRVDSSRQRGRGGGSGLGLSIVAAVVAAHQGQVEVRQTPGGGATFVVRLPASAATV
jgi:two-component system, OmpR family, sensor kinase